MKMYTKILLSFLAVLFVTEVLVFYLFIMVPVRQFDVRSGESAEKKVIALKEVVEEKIRSKPATPWSENEPLKAFVSDFARLGVKIWLTDKDGALAVASFPGGAPDIGNDVRKERPGRYLGYALHRRRRSGFYTSVPITSPAGQSGTMHILFDRQGFPPHEGHFAIGLAVIGFFIALAIIPISRLITRQIKQLRESAIRIAEGDLAHRAMIDSRNEIGQLAHAFNGMTDRLENMIVGGRELTANVSHELRTPLTRIRIAEELLREKMTQGRAEEWAENLDAIREDVEELDTLIGRMLELSKLDMRVSPLEPEPLDPAKMASDLLEKFRPVIDRKGLRVATELSYEPPFLCDKEVLRSALINVVDNAVKFTAEKGAISVMMGRRPDGLEVRVTNTFERLPEEDLSRIFDPFHRTTRSPASGSGLGLAIAKRAIERHGGSIEARNTGEGLEIRMFLPPLKVPSGGNT